MGDPSEYNEGGVPGGTLTIGDELEKNCTDSKGRGLIQRYQVSGGDLEVVQSHHEQSTPIRHHAT